MLRRWLGLGALLPTILVLAAPASAAPILYRYDGIGSGSLGGSDFSDAAFTIRAWADTDDVAPWISADLQNTHQSTSIEIAGLGSFDITTPSHTWMTVACCGGIGEDLSANWITLDEAGMVGFGLDTDWGPVVDPSPQDVSQFTGVSTSGGSLTFTSMSTATFTAIVPEPGLPLLLLTLGGPILLARRKRLA